MLPSDLNRQAALLAILSGDPGPLGLRSWGWLIHFADREPITTHCTPPATRDEVLAGRPGAISAEPLAADERPRMALSEGDEAAILAWLHLIGEHDDLTIAHTIGRCRQDAAALAYFLGRARHAEL